MARNRVWPAHPQPCEDELFSSWMCRVAMANGQKLTSLLSLAVPGFKSLSINIDSAISAEALKHIVSYLNTPFNKAVETTLWSYLGYVCEASTPRNKHMINILDTGETNSEQHFQQYCPECLSDCMSYFRRCWRLSFITVCSKHRCILLDQCPSCGVAVNYLKNQTRYKSKAFKGALTDCYQCGFDIKNAKAEPADPHVLKDISWYRQIIRQGYIELKPDIWIYSFSFFCVFRHLMRLALDCSLDRKKELEVDTARVKNRYQAMVKLSGIFRSWPEEFILRCQEMDICYSKLTSMNKTCYVVPYWFDSQVKQELYSPNVDPSIESVLSAIEVMKCRGEKINITRLNLFMGFRDSGVIKAVLKRQQRSGHV